MQKTESIFTVFAAKKESLTIKGCDKIHAEVYGLIVKFIPHQRSCDFVINLECHPLPPSSNLAAFSYVAMYIARERKNTDSYFFSMVILKQIKAKFESFGEIFDFPFLEINTQNICASEEFKKQNKRFVFDTKGVNGFFIWDTQTSKFVSHNSYASIDSFIENEMPFIIEFLREVDSLPNN